MKQTDDVSCSIERIMFQAWPALEAMEYDGWVLRFANGYTKRANSVNPHFGSSSPLREKITRCEDLYQRRELDTIFRLTPFSKPESLEDVLARHGYERVDPSLVMMTEISDDKRFLPSLATQVPGEQWFETFGTLRNLGHQTQRDHREIVEASQGDRCFALLSKNGAPCACGLGVLVDNAICLFDLFTAEDHRRQGHGAAVVSAILRWARVHGARKGLLQVERENAPARRLYERFGFEIAYPYWYRVKRNQ